MAGDAGLDTLDARDFPAMVHRVSPWLVTSQIGISEAFQALALVACGIISQKFVAHHLPAPCRVKQGNQESVLDRVAAGQLPGGPAGLLAGQ